eukprot:CAMPEP_0115865548 /NCGR_PEP_ID=MMETSP0287-20121206/19778_1 /TAXON_ID=412157 /ORGANISM="Chrysochromulina rotalis, Strain UIO044" /LENGTH=732 /DNA_ID=CAMNT_0003320063 /DNA_START=40 /DNA_END=2238 /DNA_ORIENTATION=+
MTNDKDTEFCWGTTVRGSKPYLCVASYKCGVNHLKNKFCPECHKNGIQVAASRLRMLLPTSPLIGNGTTEGFWNTHNIINLRGRYRVINQTAKCAPPSFLLLEDHTSGLSAAPFLTNVPASFIDCNGMVTLLVRNGTLVPHDPSRAQRRRKPSHAFQAATPASNSAVDPLAPQQPSSGATVAQAEPVFPMSALFRAPMSAADKFADTHIVRAQPLYASTTRAAVAVPAIAPNAPSLSVSGTVAELRGAVRRAHLLVSNMLTDQMFVDHRGLGADRRELLAMQLLAYEEHLHFLEQWATTTGGGTQAAAPGCASYGRSCETTENSSSQPSAMTFSDWVGLDIEQTVAEVAEQMVANATDQRAAQTVPPLLPPHMPLGMPQPIVQATTIPQVDLAWPITSLVAARSSQRQDQHPHHMPLSSAQTVSLPLAVDTPPESCPMHSPQGLYPPLESSPTMNWPMPPIWLPPDATPSVAPFMDMGASPLVDPQGELGCTPPSPVLLSPPSSPPGVVVQSTGHEAPSVPRLLSSFSRWSSSLVPDNTKHPLILLATTLLAINYSHGVGGGSNYSAPRLCASGCALFFLLSMTLALAHHASRTFISYGWIALVSLGPLFFLWDDLSRTTEEAAARLLLIHQSGCSNLVLLFVALGAVTSSLQISRTHAVLALTCMSCNSTLRHVYCAWVTELWMLNASICAMGIGSAALGFKASVLLSHAGIAYAPGSTLTHASSLNKSAA